MVVIENPSASSSTHSHLLLSATASTSKDLRTWTRNPKVQKKENTEYNTVVVDADGKRAGRPVTAILLPLPRKQREKDENRTIFFL
jgi:hypothetical protein